MLIDLLALATILLLMRSSDVLLSVYIGIRCCRWPRSLSFLRTGTDILVFKNNASSSASSDDDIKLHMIVDRLRTAPLFERFYSSLDSKRWPPTRMSALFLER